MNKYRHIHVRFKDNGTTYTYRVPSSYKIAKGQFVVVLGHEGKCILQVREVLEDYVEKQGIKYKSIYGIVRLVKEPKPVGLVAQELPKKSVVTLQDLYELIES